MTTAATATDRGALAQSLRALKLSGMLDTLDARLAQAAPASSATWTSSRSCARTRSPAAKHCPWPGGCATPGSKARPPWKASTSAPPPNCPPP